jgi:copper(I)-binding protein
MRLFPLILALTLIVSATAYADEQKIGSLVLRSAFMDEAPAGTSTAPVYLVIYNIGNTSDQLIGVASGVAAKATIPSGAIDLPPHSKVKLSPGGLHITLLGLKQHCKFGETHPVTFTFAKSGSVTMQVTVARILGPFE